MTRKKLVLIVTVTVIAIGAVAYAAGYWPEHQRRVALEREVDAFQQRLAESDARVRLAGLLGQLLHVTEEVAGMNYGQAQILSSRFFDDVRAESDRAADAGVRTVLQSILQNRDAVTSALARADATVLDTLRHAQTQLRAALGYPVPGGAR